jgi:hypothetical protein
MVDNTTLNAGAGGDSIGTDDIGGVKYQRVKLIEGADGVNDGDISSANPLPTEMTAVTGTDGGAGPASVLSVGGTESGGNIQELRVDADGHLQVDVLSGGGGGTERADDTDTHAAAQVGTGVMAVADPTNATVDANDYGHLSMSTDRRLKTDAQIVGQDADVTIADGGNSLTVDTVADGTAGSAHGGSQQGLRIFGSDLTNDRQVRTDSGGILQVDSVSGDPLWRTDDSDTHTPAVSKGTPIMGVADPTDTSVDANDFGHVAMTTDRRLQTNSLNYGEQSSGNTTTTPLGGSATFTGTGEQSDHPDVLMSVKADQTGTLFMDFSVDAATLKTFPPAGFAIEASIHEFHVAVKGPRWFRTRLVNDGTPQGLLRLYTYYGTFNKPNAPVGVAINDDSDGIVTHAVLTGKTGGGSYVNIGSSTGGSLKIDVEENVGNAVALNTGNADAGTQRLVLAADQPVVSIDDNGASLTVDNGGTFATQDSNLSAAIGTDGGAGPADCVSVGGTEAGGNIQEMRVDSDGHLQVDVLTGGGGPANVISTNNSTTTPLGISGVFTGTGDDVSSYDSITVQLDSDVDSATDGMTFQFSIDNTNWDDVYILSYLTANDSRHFQFPVTGQYFRIVYTNGGTGQAHFRVQTILHQGNVLASIHRLGDNVSPDRSAQLVGAALVAQAAGAGDFVPVQSTAGGNLKISVEEVNGATPTFGSGVVDAGTQRVVLATDQPVVSIDDNAGSLTVDGTVTADAGTGPWPVTDNAGSLTVDAPVATPVNVQISDGTDTALVSAAGAVHVDGSAVTQPVSGTVSVTDGLNVEGDVAHDTADSGNPNKMGMKALSHGTAPTEVANNDRSDLYCNVAGVPFMIGGHPNVQTIRANYTAAQTNAAIVSTTEKLVVTRVSVTADNANTVDVQVRIGFAAATTPTTTGVLLSHPGIAPGSGVVEGSGAGMLGVGAAGEDIRITSEVPTTGSIDVVVSYYEIAT